MQDSANGGVDTYQRLIQARVLHSKAGHLSTGLHKVTNFASVTPMLPTPGVSAFASYRVIYPPPPPPLFNCLTLDGGPANFIHLITV